MRLFIELYLDEDVSVLLSELLKSRGFVDFEKLHNEYLKAGKEHYGIIIAGRRDEYSMLKRILRILNRITADEMKNQLRYI